MSKSFILLEKSFLGNFYRHLATFYCHTVWQAYLGSLVQTIRSVVNWFMPLIEQTSNYFGKIRRWQSLPTEVSFLFVKMKKTDILTTRTPDLTVRWCQVWLVGRCLHSLLLNIDGSYDKPENTHSLGKDHCMAGLQFNKTIFVICM